MVTVFPPRNLGLGEPWGRSVENEIVRLKNSADLTGQSQGNLSRHKNAQDSQTARQIGQIQGLLDQLKQNQERISQTVDTGSWSESVSGNSWGGLHEVERPPWAFTAIVIAGMDNFSNQSSPWYGRIEVIASDTPPVTGDVGKSKDPVDAQVNGEFVTVGSNPRVVIFPGSDEDEETHPSPLYLQARGVREGGGTASRTYTYELAYAVIWR